MIERGKSAYTSIVWSVGAVPGVVRHRAASRVWPRTRLPIGGRPGESNPALAIGRRGVCQSAAAARRRLVEHRGGAAGQRRAAPITYLLRESSHAWGWDFRTFIEALFDTNLVLLCFNMLPIYPLDGGQILQSLLWFVMGQARSLLVAATIGIIGAVGGILYIFIFRGGDMWLLFIGAFAITMAWNGVQTARKMLAYERHRRRTSRDDHEYSLNSNAQFL